MGGGGDGGGIGHSDNHDSMVRLGVICEDEGGNSSSGEDDGEGEDGRGTGSGSGGGSGTRQQTAGSKKLLAREPAVSLWDPAQRVQLGMLSLDCADTDTVCGQSDATMMPLCSWRVFSAWYRARHLDIKRAFNK